MPEAGAIRLERLNLCRAHRSFCCRPWPGWRPSWTPNDQRAFGSTQNLSLSTMNHATSIFCERKLRTALLQSNWGLPFILGSLERAEVFLTFSVDALINYLSENSHDMKAFGEIDIDPGFVKEIVAIKESEQVGYRILIQNALYQHVQSATCAPFYSPFFIK